MLVDDNDTDNFISKRIIEITRFAEEVEIKSSGKSALEYLEENKEVAEKLPDLIFLDVQMPELSGIQFAKIVKGKYPVILTTAYEQYALQGYELEVVDYLLKPISLARFQKAVQKLQTRLSKPPTEETQEKNTTNANYIFIKSGYKTIRIDYDEILYLEGLSDYVRIQTKDESILTLDTMKHLLQTLPADRFIRVHKSYIVAFDKIDFIEKNRIIIQDKYIPISATYQEAFWQRIKPTS